MILWLFVALCGTALAGGKCQTVTGGNDYCENTKDSTMGCDDTSYCIGGDLYKDDCDSQSMTPMGVCVNLDEQGIALEDCEDWEGRDTPCPQMKGVPDDVYPEECQCEDSFEWEGVTYTECTVTSPYGKSWCYVKGGADCAAATESTANPGNYYIQNCGSGCDCMDSWPYDTVTYEGCAKTDDDDVPWCYIKDAAECDYATASTLPSAPSGGWRYCEDPQCTKCADEDCKGNGTCLGIGDQVCYKDTGLYTQDSAGEEQCYQDFGYLCAGCKQCEKAGSNPCLCTDNCGWSSTDNKCQNLAKTDCGECSSQSGCVATQCVASGCPSEYDPMRICQCTEDCEKYGNCCDDRDTCFPCECMDEFTWKKKTYNKCAITEPFEKSWCYVKGGATCTDATESTENPGMYYIEDCGNPCDCKASFEYDGNTYTECTVEADDTPWCYVVNPDKCDKALSVASTENVGESYKYCEEKGDDYTEMIDKKKCMVMFRDKVDEFGNPEMKPNGKPKQDMMRFDVKWKAVAACEESPDCTRIYNRGCTAEEPKPGKKAPPYRTKRFLLCDNSRSTKLTHTSRHCIWEPED